MTSRELNPNPPLASYLDSRLSGNSLWRDFCSQADVVSAPLAASTPREILQQPWLWSECAGMVAQRFDTLSQVLDGIEQVYLTGAGSSFFVGKCLESFLQERLGVRVVAVPSTDLVLASGPHLERGRPGLVISFSRSGRSPESFEAARTISQLPEYRQLLITCDGTSALAQRFHETPNTAVLALHRASCDRGLAMTSSFTSMVVAAQALGFLDDADAYLQHVSVLSELGSEVLDSAVQSCQDLDWSEIRRGCLLASGGGLNGVAMEGALKMLEMSDGRIATISDSFLGVRHGPLSFVDSHTLVLYFASSQPSWRRYERDLMQEIRDKGLGARRIAVGCGLEELEDLVEEGIEIRTAGTGLDDSLRAPLDVMLPQVLAVRLSLASGLNPDNPSRRGAISRVVQGVTIHGS